MSRFAVEAKCGHVGRNNYIIKRFAITAENGKEAAQKARFLPRVKHDHKDAILSVQLLDEVSYLELLNKNRQDPYFRCKNIQEQKSYKNV